MSLPDSTDTPQTGAAGGPGVFVQKAQSDIYTVLLAISLAAILVAILCLSLEWRANDQDRTGAVAPSSSFAYNVNVLEIDPVALPRQASCRSVQQCFTVQLGQA